MTLKSNDGGPLATTQLWADSTEGSQYTLSLLSQYAGARPSLFEKWLRLQGVQTLSVKSNLLILPIQSWSNYNSLGSNWPQDKCNLF